MMSDANIRLSVILVSPRNPLNIGAAARAMANFGVADLRVVTPFDAAWREAKSAVEAESILASAREFPTLYEAVADSTLVLGTGTSTYRRPDQPHYFLPAAAPVAAAELARQGRIALVFGSEKHGLTRNDLSLCHAIVEIPTHPGQPSMNLGQSVAVCLYAFAAAVPTQPAYPEHPGLMSRPASGEIERLTERILTVARLANYSPASMEEANREDLRLLLRRWQLTAHDIRRAMGLFRRIEWHLRNNRNGQGGAAGEE